MFTSEFEKTTWWNGALQGLEILLISYFILLFRNEESVISNYILLCCSKSYIILVVDFS